MKNLFNVNFCCFLKGNVLIKNWRYFLFVLISLSSSYSLEAQKEYVLTTPSRITSVSGTSGVDPSDLISFFAESLSLYGGASCLEEINLQRDSRIKAEMKNLKSEKPYVLVVSFKECRFVSLFPKAETGKWKDGIWLDPDWTVFHITLYPSLH